MAWHLFVASYALSKVVVIGSILLLQVMNLVYISMNMHHDVFQLAIVDLDNLASLCVLWQYFLSSWFSLWHVFWLIQFVSLTKSFLQEIDELNIEIDDKRGSLLMMNFSIEEVEFAIRKLGMRMYIFICNVALCN